MAAYHDIELVPGTEIMSKDGTAEKTLVPQPSLDPQDPLNWSKPWKRK